MPRVGAMGQSVLKKREFFFLKLIFIPAITETETLDSELTTEPATLTRRPNPTQWLDQWIDRWLNGPK